MADSQNHDHPSGPRRSERLTKLLLVGCSVFFASSLVLGALLVRDRHELAAARTELLGRVALQRELLAASDSDHALFPHVVRGVSYVLNPHMERASWYAAPGETYRINSLGLRGEEIGPKPPGVRRVVLVGDSVLFGWKLRDEERLEARLRARRGARPAGDSRLDRVEFVTVALPGWSIADQDRFLRSHLRRIAPDAVIWSVLRNDVNDAAGVVPPGLLAGWNSPAKRGDAPFQIAPALDRLGLPAPSILRRWEENFERIDLFSREHAIPVSLLWWRARERAWFDWIAGEAEWAQPVVHVPGRYRYDDENWCVAPPDCHPTEWANQRLAIGLLGALSRQGTIGPVDWSPEEEAILRAFDEEAGNRSTPGEQESLLLERAARIPASIGDGSDEGLLFGIREGRMARNGIVVVRAPVAAPTLRVELEVPSGRAGPAQRVRIEARTLRGRLAEQSATLRGGHDRLEIELEEARAGELVEVEWHFDQVECSGPSACSAARFVRASLERSP